MATEDGLRFSRLRAADRFASAGGGCELPAAFHNVLVAVDGSVGAARALAYAIDIAHASHARLTLFTAVVPIGALTMSTVVGASAVSLLPDPEDVAEETARAARARVPGHIPVTGVVASLPVRKGLLRQVKRGDHDLVVIGCRSRRAWHVLVPGSVSRFLRRHSPVPVVRVQDIGAHTINPHTLKRRRTDRVGEESLYPRLELLSRAARLM